MNTTRSLVGLLALVVIPACGRDDSPPDASGPAVTIAVAPLRLAGISEAIYTLSVDNGEGAPVWRREGISSTRYGDGAGSLSYVGPCDASANDNIVTVELTQLLGPGGADLAGTWQNPTPVSLAVTCTPNTDTFVEFNLVILRDANQGFFDIAVTFDDIFCSAKLDCKDALLHVPGGERGPTVVMAFACTAGPGQTTYLHMSDLRVVCDGGTVWVDPSQPVGNRGPVGVFNQTAFYRGSEAFQGQGVDKCYWNSALGITLGDGAKSCHLYASATASSSSWPEGHTPERTTYPFVYWDVTLTDDTGNMVCTAHPLNGEPAGVGTRYTPISGATFTHETSCDGTPTSQGRMLCGNMVVDGEDAAVAFYQTADGVSVAVGGQRTGNYTLPSGYSLLDDCCTNDCCTAAP